jgi:hypothetical protein
MLRAMLVAKQERLLSRDHEIEHLVVVIAKLRRHPLRRQARGVPRETEQLELKLEELETRRGQREKALATFFSEEDSSSQDPTTAVNALQRPTP